MKDYDDLRTLLQEALPPVEKRPVGRDLWGAVLTRRSPGFRWNWLDLGAAGAIAILLALFPELFWLLLYHL